MCTDSASPFRTLYMLDTGSCRRVPVFNLVGTPNPSTLSRLPADIEAVAFEKSDPSAAIETVDRAHPRLTPTGPITLTCGQRVERVFVYREVE